MTETEAERTRAGILYALATFGAWGFNPFYFKAVAEIPPIEVIAHRVIWSSLLLAALISWGRQWPQVRAAVTARRTLATLTLTSLIIGANWLIYIRAMDTD
jgi:chloramphenicol-sensitive protein RarD